MYIHISYITKSRTFGSGTASVHSNGGLLHPSATWEIQEKNDIDGHRPLTVTPMKPPQISLNIPQITDKNVHQYVHPHVQKNVQKNVQKTVDYQVHTGKFDSAFSLFIGHLFLIIITIFFYLYLSG